MTKQFGASGECMDHIAEIRERERAEYLATYPTRWARFLHWIRWW